MLKPAAAQSKELLGVGGGGFEIGTGGHPSVLKWDFIKPDRGPVKPDRGPAETMPKPAAAQSKELLGVGEGLRSGQGAIRQF